MENSKVVTIGSKITKFQLVQKEVVLDYPILITDVSLPEESKASVKTLRAEGKKWYVTIAYRDHSDIPFAIFCQTNNREGSTQTSDAIDRFLLLARNSGILEDHVLALEGKMNGDSNVSKLTRVISLLLRHQVPIKNIVLTLDKMDTIFVGSFLFQIKKLLSNYIKNGEKVEGANCTECRGTSLVYSEGCMSCLDCGNSKCS